MNLLFVAIDRLHLGFLGCYGNTWVTTPAFDRLASTGFTFDAAVVDTLDLDAAYDSLWRGKHVLERSAAAAATWAEVARRAGLQTLLAADDPRVLAHAAGSGFDAAVELPPAAVDGAAASEVAQTHAARAAADVIEQLGDVSRPFAMWFHWGTLGGAWDALPEFRERYRDEDDPPVPTFTQLPTRTLPPDGDLDERFGFAQAYAGQLTLVDLCLGGLLEHLDESGLAADTAVVVCGLRGLALGEHQQVALEGARAYVENVRVPLIVRLPQQRQRWRRSNALVQPCDVVASTAQLLSDPSFVSSSIAARSWIPIIEGAATSLRDRALVAGADEQNLRTARWSWRRATAEADEESQPELFVLPDDYWEVNDVADRVPEAAEALEQCYRDTAVAWSEGREAPPLPEAERLFADA